MRILIIGTHPDDADTKAGGTAAKWYALGHMVRLVSLTDCGAAHQIGARAEPARPVRPESGRPEPAQNGRRGASKTAIKVRNGSTREAVIPEPLRKRLRGMVGSKN